MKTLILAFGITILFSCSLPDEGDQIGFQLIIVNKSGLEHDNAKLIIGGMNDGEFVATESYLLPKILVLSNDWPDTKGGQTQFIALNENRWNPNLELIRAIPCDSAYFAFQFEGEEEILLYDFWDKYKGDLVSVYIPKGKIIKNDDGDLSISIEKETVLAHLRSERDTQP